MLHATPHCRSFSRAGALAVERGIGGVFPWMLNYDSMGSTGGCIDDSLFQWLRQGLRAGLPPAYGDDVPRLFTDDDDIYGFRLRKR
jgi:hypothetical protein